MWFGAEALGVEVCLKCKAKHAPSPYNPPVALNMVQDFKSFGTLFLFPISALAQTPPPFQPQLQCLISRPGAQVLRAAGLGTGSQFLLPRIPPASPPALQIFHPEALLTVQVDASSVSPHSLLLLFFRP